MYNVEYDLILTAAIFVENHLEPRRSAGLLYIHIF